MGSTAYRNDFIESFYEKGLAEGEAKGLAEGEARGHGEDLMKLLGSRGIYLTAESRARITACTDVAQLRVWFDRALTASTAADVFAP